MARKLVWLGSSHKDFVEFPKKVRRDVLAALLLAEKGEKATRAKPLLGFSGASVLEIVERDSSGAYRCVYTVKFQTAVYVLHAFQKKSHKGIATPKEDIEMIKRRLKLASETDAEIIAREKKGRK
ncbi:MAG TPA: type II toxin-antitoxin system RelE/ParE family toxin [Ktedonobacteraceae bacterium]|nr:type II toxin-antitoxin system RelE/ParE family toxin [Ktedonobacteraceae bacterium]